MVRLADLWPSGDEIDAAVAVAADPADYAGAYEAAEASDVWKKLDVPATPVFPWDEASTYIRRPPFASARAETRLGRYVAHPLIVLGDDITTDHISPAGQIPARSDAADHLVARGEDRGDLNVFASRRGNWEVMLRGLFVNRAARNELYPAAPPGATVHAPSGEVLPLWRAAERYRDDGTPVVLVAGERYGTGSSRDWAAKGPALLGVRAVLAVSFERIHRSNLVGMGILPIRLPAEWHPTELRTQARRPDRGRRPPGPARTACTGRGDHPPGQRQNRNLRRRRGGRNHARGRHPANRRRPAADPQSRARLE